MKITIQTQIFPDETQAEALTATVRNFNEAANWLASEAFRLKNANKFFLQKTYYRELRSRFGLSAQMALLCIHHVCGAYKRDKTKQPKFRLFAAIPYDQRVLSFNEDTQKVSILTMYGRIKVPFALGDRQKADFTLPRGQSDLVRRKDGTWFLLVTVEKPETPASQVKKFLGVDLGVDNIATTSDGVLFSGEKIENTRVRYHKIRKSLQATAAKQRKDTKRPKNVTRKLKSLSGKEQRFRRDVNHCISKKLVDTAKDTGRGVALEDLMGIRERTRFRKPQRAKMAGWSFSQLRAFVTYKALLSGVPVDMVNPHNTSIRCSVCGHTEKKNRKSQAVFECLACGVVLHADINGAVNISAKAAVNRLKVSRNIAGTSSSL